jgi:hypothetical protein
MAKFKKEEGANSPMAFLHFRVQLLSSQPQGMLSRVSLIHFLSLQGSVFLVALEFELRTSHSTTLPALLTVSVNIHL